MFGMGLGGDLGSIPGIKSLVKSNLPKLLSDFSSFLGKIKLEEGEAFATIIIFQNEGHLKIMITTVDESFAVKRVLKGINVDEVEKNPEVLLNIERELREKGYLKEEVENG